MDLPICPACGQSVLDDVENCPFCGAPMKGKPGAKPAPKPTARPGEPKAAPAGPGAAKGAGQKVPAAGKAAGARAAAGAKAPKKEEGEEDVITFDGAALHRAIPLSRKPARGRMMRVVCPMCETPGFAPKEAAGREVKCVNPDCLVPVFKAPELEKKETEPAQKEETPASRPKWPLAVAALVALAAAGGGAWYFLQGGPSEKKQPPPQPTTPATPQTVEQPSGPGAGQEGSKPGPSEQTGQKQAASEPAVPTIDPTQVTNTALERMVRAAQRRERNRSKPFCRQLTTKAYAHVGDIENAKRQIEQLKLVGKDVPYFQITAWTALAWAQLEAGDEAGARQSIEAAWSLRDEIPSYGQTGADAAVDLAVPLVVLNRLNDAKQVVSEHLGQSTQGELATVLRMVFGDGTYDVDEAVSRLPIEQWEHPEWVAVAVELASRGSLAEALKWAQAAPSVPTLSDTLSVWAEAAVRSGAKGGAAVSVEQLEKAVEPLPEAYRASVLGRAAYVAAQTGSSQLARQLVQAAHQTLSQVTAPPEFVIPPMKELYELKLVSPLPLFSAAVAAAEISHTEVLLGNKEAAKAALQQALKYLRAAAPCVEVAARRDREFTRRGRSAIEAALRRELKLETPEQARLAANRYRRKCHDLYNMATERWKLQLRILSRAAEWLSPQDVWAEVQARATTKDLSQREPYFTTWLPDRLAALAEAAGNSQLAQQVRQAAGPKAPQDPRVRLQQQTLKAVERGRVVDAAKALNAYVKTNRRDSQWAERWTLQLLCRMVKQQKVPDALRLVVELENQLWREAGFQVVAALSAKQGLAGYVWQFAQNNQLPSTEEVSLLYGLVVALNPKE